MHLFISNAVIPGPTRFPIQWVPTVFCPGLMRAGHEASHSAPFSAEVKTEGNHTTTATSPACLHAVHRDEFCLSFTCTFGERDSVVSIVTRLQAGFSSTPKRPDPLWGPPSFIFDGYWGTFSGGKAIGAPICCLRRGSATARLLGLWVRISQGAWMSVSCECCVLSGRGLCDGLVTRPEESYRVWCV
jgi:hypothetical protein